MRIKVINYRGEDYRDDRMFVINLTFGKQGDTPKWILRTYKNTVSLSPISDHCFDSKEEAVSYLKSVEYQVPLISNNGNPLDIPVEVENKWEYFNEWLKYKNLFSALSEKQHCPFHLDKRGYNHMKDYAYSEIIKDGFEQEFFSNGKVKMEGTYKKGLRDGEWKSYYESGELHVHCFYTNDCNNGPYKRFHENGLVASRGNLIEDAQEGEWQYFDEDGVLIETKFFSNGVEI